MNFMGNARMTTCDETALLLSRGLDGDLSGAEAGPMYAHVARCDACRHAMGEMAVLESSLHQLNQRFDTAVLDDGFTAELAGKLEAARDAMVGSTQSSVIQMRQFGRRAVQDPTLRSKLQAASDHASFIRLCVQLGRENGFAFTAEQLESRLDSEAANDNELSDEQLDCVAAGAGFDGRKLLDLLNGLD